MIPSAVFFLLLAALLNGLATWRAFRFVQINSRLGEVNSALQPPVSIMVPVCGCEENALEHFKRFCELDWPFYQLIFTVADSSDRALSFLQQLKPSASCQIQINIGGQADGANLKVRNLLNALPMVEHDWMVICDADIKPERNFLKNLFEPLLGNNEQKIGLVHSLYRCREDSTLASSWENVWINCDFWSQGLLGDWLRGTDFAFGAAMAFHRTTLEQMGGLGAIRDYLADDYQIGHRIAGLGKKIVFSRSFVTLNAKPQTWQETWRHLLRWSKTIRVCQPAGFAGSILTNITLFAFLAFLLKPSFFLYWSLLALIFRVGCANQCRNWILGTKGIWSRWWLILFKDLAQCFLWLLAFRNSPIEWRGKRYGLLKDGKLVLQNSDKL